MSYEISVLEAELEETREKLKALKKKDKKSDEASIGHRLNCRWLKDGRLRFYMDDRSKYVVPADESEDIRALFELAETLFDKAAREK